MTRFAFIARTCCAGLAAFAPAHAQSMIEVREPADIIYHPFRSLPAGEIMAVSVSNPRDVPLDALLEIVPSQGGGFVWPTTEPLAAKVVSGSQTDRAERLRLPVSLAAGATQTLELRWTPDERRFAEPGAYRILVDVRLLESVGETVLEEHTDIPVVLRVGTDSALSIAGTSGSISADRTFAFIDFGELETGEAAHILFAARANTDVSFSISSENGGALASLDDPALRIPYAVSFDGTVLDLANEQEIARRPARDLAGSTYRMDIVVGNVEAAFAGYYQDTVTVELTAR